MAGVPVAAVHLEWSCFSQGQPYELSPGLQGEQHQCLTYFTKVSKAPRQPGGDQPGMQGIIVQPRHTLSSHTLVTLSWRQPRFGPQPSHGRGSETKPINPTVVWPHS